jgi:mRNA interferase MazF
MRRLRLQPSFQRGDLVWANLEPTIGHEQAGRRPVLVVSNDPFNAKSGTVICMPATSQKPKAGEPFTFELPETPNVPRSWVKVSQVRTLSTERLDACIDRIESRDVDRCMALLVTICTTWGAVR